MTSTWARVCDLCGATGTALPDEHGTIPPPEGWLHQDIALFVRNTSIDVCKNCCTSKMIAVLRDKLDERKGMAGVVVADGA